MDASKRVVVQVRWNRQAARWEAKFPPGFQGCVLEDKVVAGAPHPYADQQAVLVHRVARYLRMCWLRARALGQLQLYGKNGRIQWERTYGRDPKRYPS